MNKCVNLVLTSVLLCLSTSFCMAAGDGWEDLAKTPPMGWNSWNTFRLDINEDLVRGIADMFVEKG